MWVMGLKYFVGQFATWQILVLLVRPEAIACGAGLCFSGDILFFIST